MNYLPCVCKDNNFKWNKTNNKCEKCPGGKKVIGGKCQCPGDQKDKGGKCQCPIEGQKYKSGMCKCREDRPIVLDGKCITKKTHRKKMCQIAQNLQLPLEPSNLHETDEMDMARNVNNSYESLINTCQNSQNNNDPYGSFNKLKSNLHKLMEKIERILDIMLHMGIPIIISLIFIQHLFN